MTKKKKIISFLALTLAVSIIGTTTASAISLKSSFSSGTYVSYDHYAVPGLNYYTKSCWAQTKGYYSFHYVRAMIGKGNNIWADTGRQYSGGDIKITCTTPAIPCHGFSIEFPTGYAYYGN